MRMRKTPVQESVFIKHLKNDKRVAPLKRNGKIETDSKIKANILNSQFKSVFSSSYKISKEEFRKLNLNSNTPDTYPSAPEIKIIAAGILKLQQNLNIHKAGGLDDIKPIILKELANELSPILTIIFRKSLKTKLEISTYNTRIQERPTLPTIKLQTNIINMCVLHLTINSENDCKIPQNDIDKLASWE
jgi:hypothetical protein